MTGQQNARLCRNPPAPQAPTRAERTDTMARKKTSLPTGPLRDESVRNQMYREGNLLFFTKEAAVARLLEWFYPRQIKMDREWLRLNLEYRLMNNVEIVD